MTKEENRKLMHHMLDEIFSYDDMADGTLKVCWVGVDDSTRPVEDFEEIHHMPISGMKALVVGRLVQHIYEEK
jgi:hypothetical protein